MSDRDYIPEHGDIILIDYDPVKKGEIGKYRPSLILSNKKFNAMSGLVLTCPISKSIRNTNFEVPIMLERQSVIVASYPMTMSWHHRDIKFLQKVNAEVIAETLGILTGVINVNKYL